MIKGSVVKSEDDLFFLVSFCAEGRSKRGVTGMCLHDRVEDDVGEKHDALDENEANADGERAALCCASFEEVVV